MSDEREFKHLRDQQNLQNAQGRSEIESTMSSDPKKQWEEKLVGKKITEGSGSASSFSKRDLPEKHRVIPPGAIVTRDFYPDRLNVHVGEDGTCSHITMG